MLEKASEFFTVGDHPSMAQIAAAAGVSRGALYDLFGSRQATLEALGLDRPVWQDRIVDAGAELLAERGLPALSFDQVAARSGVSRATIYRLFPGKAALLRAIVRSHLPVDDALARWEAMGDRPPAEAIPALATSIARAGSVRFGVLRSVLFEVTGRQDGTEEVAAEAFRNMDVVLRYLEAQMAAGHLRRMDPLLAAQALLGPVLLHVVSRPLVEDRGVVQASLDDVIAELTDIWLLAMAPPRAGKERRSSSG